MISLKWVVCFLIILPTKVGVFLTIQILNELSAINSVPKYSLNTDFWICDP